MQQNANLYNLHICIIDIERQDMETMPGHL